MNKLFLIMLILVTVGCTLTHVADGIFSAQSTHFRVLEPYGIVAGQAAPFTLACRAEPKADEGYKTVDLCM